MENLVQLGLLDLKVSLELPDPEEDLVWERMEKLVRMERTGCQENWEKLDPLGAVAQEDRWVYQDHLGREVPLAFGTGRNCVPMPVLVDCRDIVDYQA